MFRVLCFLILISGGSTTLAQCENGQCRMPVHNTVKAVAQPVKAVAALPMKAVQFVQPVQRVATVVKARPVRRLFARKPVRRFLFRRCR